MDNAKYIEVSAAVRYWEDARVDGVTDSGGDIPLRNGENWEPVINLETGFVKDWPLGVTAEVHYKVCDEGEYWLQDAQGQRIAKWKDCYVPNAILCPKGNGYGDYIIFNISASSQIENWRQPGIDAEQWKPIEAERASQPAQDQVAAVRAVHRKTLEQIACWLDNSARIVQNGPDDYGPATEFDSQLGQAAAEISGILASAPSPQPQPSGSIDSEELRLLLEDHRESVGESWFNNTIDKLVAHIDAWKDAACAEIETKRQVLSSAYRSAAARAEAAEAKLASTRLTDAQIIQRAGEIFGFKPHEMGELQKSQYLDFARWAAGEE